MSEEELSKKHDWEAVQEALQDLQAYTEEHESYAENLLNALENVIASLPESSK